MKQFLVFAFDQYYPVGGWHDLAGQFDTLDEAREFAAASNADWTQIVDLQTGDIV